MSELSYAFPFQTSNEPVINSTQTSTFQAFVSLHTLIDMASELTESEAQRYDRQIRVWGAEAQSRIQNSRVLVCGLSNMNVEVSQWNATIFTTC